MAIYIFCFRKKALYSRRAEIFLPVIKKMRTLRWVNFLWENEQNHGPRHGPKSEVPTVGLVAPSVFIQIDWNNAGNYILTENCYLWYCFFEEFIEKKTFKDNIFLLKYLKSADQK